MTPLEIPFIPRCIDRHDEALIKHISNGVTPTLNAVNF